MKLEDIDPSLTNSIYIEYDRHFSTHSECQLKIFFSDGDGGVKGAIFQEDYLKTADFLELTAKKLRECENAKSNTNSLK